MDAMDMIAEHLIREETITGKDFMRLYREAKGIPEPAEGEEEAAAKADGMPAALTEKAAAPVKMPETAPVVVPEPETAPAQTTAPETAPDESGEEQDDEEEEKPVKKGPRGQFTNVPMEDVDRFFKE